MIPIIVMINQKKQDKIDQLEKEKNGYLLYEIDLLHEIAKEAANIELQSNKYRIKTAKEKVRLLNTDGINTKKMVREQITEEIKQMERENAILKVWIGENSEKVHI